MLRGVIYARYSSDNQREESIEGQIRENKVYAERNDIEIVNTYIDRAYSAKTTKRPAFQQMVKDSEKGLFDVIIVWKLDRFSRNRRDSVVYKALLEERGVQVLSATETLSKGKDRILTEAILEAWAEFSNIDLGEKVTRGMTDNALKCEFNGGTIPYGYCIDAQKHYQINPVQAPLVLELFRRYAGGESMTDIVEDLNARGLRTTRGNRFNKNSLTRIFNNRNYIGEYHHMGIVTPGGIPAIIPEELFERVAVRLQQNKHAPGKAKAADPYLLTTKLFCGLCKTMMVGDSANKPNGVIYRYYKCAAAKRHQCDKKAVRKDWIEEKVLAFLISLLHDEKTLDRIADEIIALLDKGNDMIPALQSQLKHVRSGIQNMMNAIEMGVVTRNTKARLQELEAEEDRLIAAIKEEEAKMPKISKEMILFTLHRYRDLDLHIQKNKERLIDGLVKAIYLYDDKLVFYLTYTDDPVTIPTAEELEAMEHSSDVNALSSPKKEHHPFGWCSFLPYGNRKAVKKTVQWTVFRPWEIPVTFDCGP